MVVYGPKSSEATNTRPAVFDAEEVRRTADVIFAEPGIVVEVRALEATTPADRFPSTYAGYFDNADPLLAALASLRSADGVYFTLNPVNPALMARAHNRIKKQGKRGNTTSDGDITRRRFILIDCDAKRPAGISSTNEEHGEADARARIIRDDLDGRGWPSPVLADSGNGAHLLYAVDLPGDDGGLVKRVLETLHQQHGDNVVAVDTSVFNPARICKLHGTVSRKGDDTPDRPHRLSHIIDAPEKLEPVTREQLEALAGEFVSETKPANSNCSSRRVNGHKFSLADFVRRHGLNVTGPERWSAVNGDSGDRYVFDVCPWNGDHQNQSAWAVQFDNGKLAAGCRHDSCKTRKWEDLRALYEQKPQLRQATSRNEEPPEPESAGASSPPSGDFEGIVFPDLVPLDAATLPKLPLAIFTGVSRDMVEAVADHTETPLECGAGTLLSALGTVCQKKLSVRIEQGYFEPVNVFTITGMEAGTRKSHAQRPFIDPLFEWESAHAAQCAGKIATATSERKTIESRLTKMRCEAAKKSGEEFAAAMSEIAEIEAAMPDVPKIPQLVTQDVTAENLPTLMADNGEAMGLFSDEGGWLETIAGRYSNGVANLDVVLQSHSGSPCRINRGSRPPVILHHPALSIGLAVQPEVIRGLAAKPGFRGRGLLARFAYMLPNPNVGWRKLDSVPLNERAVNAYRNMIIALADFKAIADGRKSMPHVLNLDHDAWTIWKAFQREVETWMRATGRLEHARDWGGKLPGLVVRLAGLLHAAAFYSNPTAQSSLDAATMERAIQLGRFLVPHALAAFDLMGADGSLDVARHLWRVIASPQRLAKVKADGKDPAYVSLRDAWHPLRNTHNSVEDAVPGAQKLVDYGYLVELPGPVGGKYRPRKYKINPKALKPLDS